MLDLMQLAPENQLDFWLGEWHVSWGDGQHGRNRVTRILGSRVIQEDFNGSPAMNFQGLSLSVYNPRLDQWQQTWVDSEGSYWHFLGGVQDNQMILAADDVVDARPLKLRMIFYNIDHDELDWRWERSDDGGQTWQEKWQIHYRRKSSTRPILES